MISKDVGTAPVADDTAVALTADFPGAYTDTPLKSVRKIIAERMMHSLTSTAQVSYQITAPADGLLSLRSRFKAADSSLGLGAITIGDLVAYSATQAILRHPALNSHLENQAIRTFDHVHLGLAVDTPRGLLVPTIRYASTLGLRALSQATKQLGVAANDGSIAPELLSGATFTVTNLGAFGVEAFTPVLNTPQSAILGVGAIRPHAVVRLMVH